MSGLSDPEREGCRRLLDQLDNDDIRALCDTITNRLVQPENRQGEDKPFSQRATAPPPASPGPRLRERRGGGRGGLSSNLPGSALGRNPGDSRPPPGPWGRWLH